MVTVTKISDRVYVLKDRFDCCADLVIGSKGALLFDTGCGIDDMREAVLGITQLPLIVIASHGHFDHIGGSRFFDEVFLSDRDRCVIDGYNEELLNKWIVEMGCDEKSIPVNFGCDGWKQISPLTASRILLGNIEGEIVPLPGHSLGSVGVLFRELRLLLGGDALEPVMCLMFQNHGDRAIHMETLKKVMGLEFDNFLTSHSDKLFSKSIIPRMIRCIENCDGKRFHQYRYPKPPYSEGWIYVDSIEDEPVGVIISDEENRKRLGE